MSNCFENKKYYITTPFTATKNCPQIPKKAANYCIYTLACMDQTFQQRKNRCPFGPDFHTNEKYWTQELQYHCLVKLKCQNYLKWLLINTLHPL